jgi:hypothetical protein
MPVEQALLEKVSPLFEFLVVTGHAPHRHLEIALTQGQRDGVFTVCHFGHFDDPARPRVAFGRAGASCVPVCVEPIVAAPSGVAAIAFCIIATLICASSPMDALYTPAVAAPNSSIRISTTASSSA